MEREEWNQKWLGNKFGSLKVHLSGLSAQQHFVIFLNYEAIENLKMITNFDIHKCI